MKGDIIINLEGAGYETLERCRLIIHTLFEQGVFNIRRGEASLQFDEKGDLGAIEIRVLKWNKKYAHIPLQNLLDNAKIEIINQPSTLTRSG